MLLVNFSVSLLGGNSLLALKSLWHLVLGETPILSLLQTHMHTCTHGETHTHWHAHIVNTKQKPSTIYLYKVSQGAEQHTKRLFLAWPSGFWPEPEAEALKIFLNTHLDSVRCVYMRRHVCSLFCASDSLYTWLVTGSDHCACAHTVVVRLKSIFMCVWSGVEAC